MLSEKKPKKIKHDADFKPAFPHIGLFRNLVIIQLVCALIYMILSIASIVMASLETKKTNHYYGRPDAANDSDDLLAGGTGIWGGLFGVVTALVGIAGSRALHKPILLKAYFVMTLVLVLLMLPLTLSLHSATLEIEKDYESDIKGRDGWPLRRIWENIEDDIGSWDMYEKREKFERTEGKEMGRILNERRAVVGCIWAALVLCAIHFCCALISLFIVLSSWKTATGGAKTKTKNRTNEYVNIPSEKPDDTRNPAQTDEKLGSEMEGTPMHRDSLG